MSRGVSFTIRHPSYFAKLQQLLEIDRWDIAARLACDAAVEMRNYVVLLQQGIEAWKKALATNAEGLFAGVLKGRARVDGDRRAQDTLSCVRNVVNDPDYEAKRYEYYTSQARDAVSEVVGDLVWDIEKDQIRDSKTRELRPYLKIVLRIRNKDDENVEELVLAPQAVQSNVDGLLRRCRRVFQAARQAESISAYLMDKYDGRTPNTAPEALADEIFEKNEPLLGHAGHSIPYNYLRVHHDPRLPLQLGFLQRILTHLAGRSQVPLGRAAQIVSSSVGCLKAASRAQFSCPGFGPR